MLMRFYALKLKYMKISMATILDCNLLPSWAISSMSSGRFEIDIQKSPCISIFVHLSLITTIRPLKIPTNRKSKFSIYAILDCK